MWLFLFKRCDMSPKYIDISDITGDVNIMISEECITSEDYNNVVDDLYTLYDAFISANEELHDLTSIIDQMNTVNYIPSDVNTLEGLISVLNTPIIPIVIAVEPIDLVSMNIVGC